MLDVVGGDGASDDVAAAREESRVKRCHSALFPGSNRRTYMKEKLSLFLSLIVFFYSLALE